MLLYNVAFVFLWLINSVVKGNSLASQKIDQSASNYFRGQHGLQLISPSLSLTPRSEKIVSLRCCKSSFSVLSLKSIPRGFRNKIKLEQNFEY